MAPFNPTPNPTQDPSYLGLSKPISDVKANTTMGEVFKGIGDIGSAAVEGVDFLVKKNASDEIHAAIDAERNDYANDLRAARTVAGGGKLADAFGPKGDLTTTNAPDVPAGLSNLKATLDTLDSGKANGKLSETAFYGRLDMLAKTFRSQYPGYRDYIDKEFEKITGVNPANAEIKGLISDINSFVTNASSRKDKDETWLRSVAPTVPGAAALLPKFHNNEISINEVYQTLQPRLADEAQMKFNSAVLGDYKGAREKVGLFTKDLVTTEVNKSAAGTLDTLTVSIFGNQVKMTDFLTGFQSGQYKNVPDEAWVQANQLVEGGKQEFIRATNKLLDTPVNEKGDTRRTLMGHEEAGKLMNQGVAYFDDVQKSIGLKDPGTALYTTNILKAQATGTLKAFFDNKDTGAVMRLLKGANDIGGPAFAQVMLSAGIQAGLSPPDRANLAVVGSQLVTPPDIRNTGNKTTVVPQNYNIVQPIVAAQKEGKPAELIQEILKVPQLITKPSVDDAAKVELAKKTYRQDTIGLISKFAVDGTDKNGNWIKGRYNVWSDLTSSQMMKELFQLNKLDPSIGPQVGNWVETTFATDGMFNKELQDMRNVVLPPGYQMIWNTEKHGLDVVDAQTKQSVLNTGFNRALSPQSIAKFQQQQPLSPFIQDTVKRLNIGLQGLGNYAKESGMDVDAYLVRTMIGLGFNPSAPAQGQMFGPGIPPANTTIPQHIIDAIVTGRGGTGTPGKPAQYTEEPKTPTIGEWLKNPVGKAPFPTTNLSDHPILGMDTQEIPKGMSARDFLKLLKQQGK